MGAFDEDLRRFGPANLGYTPLMSQSQAEAYCRRLAATHYENFPVLSCMLPRRLRQPFANLYAWCRWADDLADEVGGDELSTELLAWRGEQLAACYSGNARHPVLIALQATIRQFELPPQPFEDLISAFRQDQRVHAYESFAQLEDYCRRSANPVGRLVLRVCERNDPTLFGWSDSICTGLQLANFWQDVARDAESGRVYLPREDRERFGYTDEALRTRLTNRAFIDLMQFQATRARDYLTAGLPLVEKMSGRMQIVMELFAQGGLRILDRIESIGYRVWDFRPVLTKRDVLLISGRCLKHAVRRSARLGQGDLIRTAEGPKPSP